MLSDASNRIRPEPFAEVDAWLAPFRRFWNTHVDGARTPPSTAWNRRPSGRGRNDEHSSELRAGRRCWSLRSGRKETIGRLFSSEICVIAAEVLASADRSGAAPRVGAIRR
jgi:hypothetical protein